MTKFEKIGTMIAAGVGAIAGIWGAYTAHDASKFHQPLELHTEMVLSFKNQISSAEQRKDSVEVIRVRKLFETFEEAWRNSKKLKSLVVAIEALAVNDVPDNIKLEIQEILNSFEREKPDFPIDPKTLGSAYFAIGDYKEAAEHFSVANTEYPTDANTSVLKAASLGRLSLGVKNGKERASIEENAYESWLNAQHIDKADKNMASFFENEVALKGIVEERVNK